MAYTYRIAASLAAILRCGAHFGAVICLALLITLRPASADSTDDAINVAVNALEGCRGVIEKDCPAFRRRFPALCYNTRAQSCIF